MTNILKYGNYSLATQRAGSWPKGSIINAENPSERKGSDELKTLCYELYRTRTLRGRHPMALRLIEVFLPTVAKNRVEMALEGHTVLSTWKDEISEMKICIKILVPSEETQKIVDILEKEFSLVEGFRIIIFPVEATIPRPPPKEECVAEDEESECENKLGKRIPCIPREELYADVKDTIRFSWVYILLVILSSIVASVGILRNNVAVIIGAMVIAPLLGPNVALCLATTLGDIDLARRAMKANLLGIFTALFFSAVLGFVVDVDTGIHEIETRTEVSMGDIVLALAAGAAAALSFTTRAYSALIGVMVAVALLPPLVVLGMLLGSGEWALAQGALLLLLVNIIGINLSGVMVFLAQGIQPLYWWEADKAKKGTRIAVALWTILLIVLAAVILLSQR